MISRPQPGTGWQSLGGSGSGVTDQAIVGPGGSRVVRKSGPVIRSPALREVSVIEWSVTHRVTEAKWGCSQLGGYEASQSV